MRLPLASLASPRPYAIAIAALAATALLAPAAAHAGPLVSSAPDCDEQDLTQPFMPWLDPAQYQFAPDGGFEAGADGWELDGATVVDGNESHHVHGSGDSKSLRFGAGDSATSPTICVGLEHPTLRLFAKRAAGLSATMGVEVLFEDALGNVQTLSVGSHAGTSGWQPTLPMPVVANLLPLLPGEHTPVRFRFTGVTGGVQIDDVYVDPYRRS